MSNPLWTHGKKRDEDRKRRADVRQMNANYRIRYSLAFDGGGLEFNVYYRTIAGARISAFFWMHIRSWGGSAKLYPYPEPEAPPRHMKKEKRFAWLRSR